MRKHLNLMEAASVAALFTSTSAFAQSQAQPAAAVETVTVTGTSIRGVAPVGSAVVSLSRDEILNTAIRDPAELIRDLPQGSGLGNQVTSGGSNLNYAQGVDLRGLGSEATLVLFDGHRLVGQGIIDEFANPNQLPISAIQRVEVVTDGASAIYGSDAVAGVVNYILRNQYDGLEINVHDATSLYNTTSVDAIWGTSWTGGNIWIGALYKDQGTFVRAARAYLKDDLRPLGGNDNRTVLTATVPGQVGNILVDGILYGLPTTNGAVPTAAQVKALAGNPNLADSGDYTWYQPEQNQYAVTLKAHQTFLDGRAEVSFTSTDSILNSLTHEFDTSVSIPIPSTSPYYIPGLAKTAGTALTLQYNTHLNGTGYVRVDNRPADRSYNHTLDASFDINDNWRLSGYYTQGDDHSCGRCGPRGDNSFAQLATTNFSSIFNPYVVGPQTAFLNNYWQVQNQTGGYTLKDVVGKLEGDLYTLPGGDIRFSIGGEYTRTTDKLRLYGYNGDINDHYSVTRDTSDKRKVTSGFAEMFIPIVSEANSIPGIQTLNLSVAGRYDSYSDFGGTTNPKVGVTYEPFSDLSLRASWGTSFRAPTLTEINPGVVLQYNRVQYSNGAKDPSIPVQNAATGTTLVLSRLGNTPGLTPETATTMSFGGDYKPSYIPGLQLSLTYYNVDYINRIEALPNPTSALTTPANRALYAPFIIAAPQPKTCVPFNFATYNPLYLPYVTADVFATATSTANDCSLAAVILGGERNLGQLKQNGIDIKANYQFSTDEWGNFNASLNASKIIELKKSFLPGGPLTNELDKIGFQVSTRATARLAWSQGPWAAGLSANFTGPYTNNLTITVNGTQYPDTHIPAWTTFGLNLSYRLPEIAGYASVASGVLLAARIDNVTDRQPPIVLTGTSAFDQANANPYGRILSFDITKTF